MRLSLLFILFVLSLVACKNLGERSDPTLARVENAELKLSALSENEGWDSLSFESRMELVENWVNRESVYERALADGVGESPEVKRLLEDAKRKIVLGAYLAQVTDTLSTSESDVAAYYDEHPELFALNANVYDIAVVTYASGSTAWKYYGPMSKKTILSKPEKNWLVRDVESLDSVTVFPLDCPAVDLGLLSVGKITPPKTCGKSLKSVIVLSKVDSGSVRPFAEVADFARTLAASDKRKKFIAAFKDSVKKRQAIFVYPEEISKSAPH